MVDLTSYPAADAVKALTDLGAQAQGVTITELKVPPEAGAGLPATVPVAIRHGATPGFVPLAAEIEAYRITPRRKKGTAVALTLSSFAKLTNRHRTDHSVIFADIAWRAPSLTAMIDYHEVAAAGDEPSAEGDEAGAAHPGWLQHRVRYEYPLSEQWKKWIDANGQMMGQTDFALFIEDNIADLASPFDAEKTEYERLFDTKVATPAEIMTLSRGLEIFSETRAKSATRLQSGAASIAFEETHKDAAGNTLTVPGVFMISVPPFDRGAPVRIPIRLRYRLVSGAIKWGFGLYQPERFIRERIEQDILIVAEKTGLPVYEGHPET